MGTAKESSKIDRGFLGRTTDGWRRCLLNRISLSRSRNAAVVLEADKMVLIRFLR